MYQLCVYVPESHVEELKTALFEAGAGRIGDYDSCAWESKGTGQFRPLQGSNAFVGDIGEVERICEYKVEMVCDEKHIEGVLKTLINIHPYETPAYRVYEVKTLEDFIL